MKVDISGSDFDNIFLYITDALRYDYTPKNIIKSNNVIKTASSGLATPESISSIISGLYPPQHGVWKFNSRLRSEITTIFDIQSDQSLILGYNGDVLQDMLGLSDIEGTQIEDLTTPFTLVVKDDYAHSPYGVNLEDSDPKFESHPEYWRRRAGDKETIRTEYETGAEKSAERFEAMVDQLADRDLLSDTLVIYTSDHGELLGERGLVDHGAPIRPELVYVPTVFCNDRVSVEGDFMAHVDILPTVLSALGEEVPDGLPGYDLLNGAPEDRLALNDVNRPFYSGTSVWNVDGGITFTNDSLLTRARFALQHLKDRGTAPFTRHQPFAASSEFLRRERTFGDPSFTRAEAEAFRDRIGTAVPTRDQELTDETVSRLEDLGYVEGNEL